DRHAGRRGLDVVGAERINPKFALVLVEPGDWNNGPNAGNTVGNGVIGDNERLDPERQKRFKSTTSGPELSELDVVGEQMEAIQVPLLLQNPSVVIEAL